MPIIRLGLFCFEQITLVHKANEITRKIPAITKIL